MSETKLNVNQINQVYGEMYRYNLSDSYSAPQSSVIYTVEDNNVAGFTGGGTTTAAGTTANLFSSVSDAGGGEITINTSSAHSYSAGDVVTIVLSTNYDGVYYVESVGSTTSFNITATYVATDSGGSFLSDRIIVPENGLYRVTWNCTNVGSGVSRYEVGLLAGVTRMTKPSGEVTLDAAGTRANAGGNFLYNLTADEPISFYYKLLSGTSGIQFLHSNFKIMKVSD